MFMFELNVMKIMGVCQFSVLLTDFLKTKNTHIWLAFIQNISLIKVNRFCFVLELGLKPLYLKYEIMFLPYGV